MISCINIPGTLPAPDSTGISPGLPKRYAVGIPVASRSRRTSELSRFFAPGELTGGSAMRTRDRWRGRQRMEKDLSFHMRFETVLLNKHQICLRQRQYLEHAFFLSGNV